MKRRSESGFSSIVNRKLEKFKLKKEDYLYRYLTIFTYSWDNSSYQAFCGVLVVLPYSNNKEFTPTPVPVPGKYSPNLDIYIKGVYSHCTPVPISGKYSPNLDIYTYKEFTPTPVPFSGNTPPT